ncbi:Testisin [Coemansia sp. RSA 1933]|nr:Testisin [Coemansia sp. RSA 1933]
MHPDLNLDYFDNDIALLKLKKKLKYSSTVQPIHIDTDPVVDGLTVTGIGWGKTTLASQTTANTLQQVDLHTGNEALCRRIRPEFDSNNGDYICVTTPDGRDTCSGDSGGPLLRRCSADPAMSGTAGSGPWLQMGITSYGDNAQRDADTVCASSNGAGFYTHVAKYLGFIASTTGISEKDLAASCKGAKIDVVGTSGVSRKNSGGGLATTAAVVAMASCFLFGL